MSKPNDISTLEGLVAVVADATLSRVWRHPTEPRVAVVELDGPYCTTDVEPLDDASIAWVRYQLEQWFGFAPIDPALLRDAIMAALCDNQLKIAPSTKAEWAAHYADADAAALRRATGGE